MRRLGWILFALVSTGCLQAQRKHYLREPILSAERHEIEAEWITVPLRAFSVRDDGGGRNSSTTVGQIDRWLVEANRIYAPAHIRFEFNPNLFEPLRSTLLNEVGEGNHPKRREQVARGNELAASYPGSVVLLFRFGAGRTQTGAGFAGSDANFVVMPSLQSEAFCGHANLNILAHELGHFFGLPHTFAREFESVWEAEAEAAKDPQLLDGDSFSDTPPDPFFRDEPYECDFAINSVMLGGKPFPLPRHNVMSYFDSPHKELTPQQIQIVRQGALRRTGQDLRKLVDGVTLLPLEGSKVAEADITQGQIEHQDMRGFWGTWSGNEQLLWSGGASGNTISIAFTIPEGGSFELWTGLTLGPDFAQVNVSVDDGPAHPLDLYARTVRHSGPTRVGAQTLTAGEHQLRLQIAGQNRRSTGLLVGFDYLLLKPAPQLTSSLW